jgi:hypothetical protein
MKLLSWINPKRLRDYPRLVFIGSWAIVLLNIAFSHGWIGGLTGILMWGDFIDYYAAGKLYLHDISHLYDPAIQEQTQISLVAPSRPEGYTFYSYPPNAAMLHSVLTYIPLSWAITIWCIFSICCVVLSAYLLRRHIIPGWIGPDRLSTFQLSILIFSCFAFVEGFNAGQTHSLTLLLTVAILAATKQEKWFLAGIFATLSTFKPQFVVGFLILWLIWGKWKAILCFAATSAIWHGMVLVTKGIQPYLAYLSFSNQMMYLPYAKEGFPISVMATPFTLVASILPVQLGALWNKMYIALAILLVGLFGVYVYQRRKKPADEQNDVLALAVLLPILIAPYVLLHDLLVLVAVLILLASKPTNSTNLKILAMAIYICLLFLPLIGYGIKIALTSVIPIVVLIYTVHQSIILRRIKTT